MRKGRVALKGYQGGEGRGVGAKMIPRTGRWQWGGMIVAEGILHTRQTMERR